MRRAAVAKARTQVRMISSRSRSIGEKRERAKLVPPTYSLWRQTPTIDDLIQLDRKLKGKKHLSVAADSARRPSRLSCRCVIPTETTKLRTPPHGPR